MFRVSSAKVCVCFMCVCMCPVIAHVTTASVDLYQKPKTLQSVLVSLVLCLDESNKMNALKKNKQKKNEEESQLVWNSVCLVSNLVKKVYFDF